MLSWLGTRLMGREKYRNVTRMASLMRIITSRGMARSVARGAFLLLVALRASTAHAGSPAPASTPTKPTDVHIRLQGGVCAIASPREYNQVAKFVNAPEIFSVGASIRPKRFASAALDLTFINLGKGVPSSLVTASTTAMTTVESSSLVTAMLGLELRRPTADGRGPYATLGAGFGRAFLGGVHEGPSRDPGPFLFRGTRIAGPALETGVGIRSARILDGPSVQLDVRWVGLLSGNPRVSLVPLTLGFVF